MSITLTSPLLVQFNGITQENDVTGAIVSMHVDYLSSQVTYTLKTGVLSGGNLAPGSYGPVITVVLNLLTGVWFASSGQNGTVSGVGFTNLVNQLKGDRNQAEVFAAGSSGIMPGTQVAWT